MIDKSIFRAYDVRGTYPDQLNEETASKIACAYAEVVKPKKVIVGRDLREASAKMFDGVVRALTDRGIDVYDAGEMTNPMIGFGVFNYNFDGGIILSASHNPIGYGGMKMTKAGAVTLPGNDPDLIKYATEGVSDYSGPKGEVKKFEIKNDYIKFVRSLVNLESITEKNILFDAMYGSVGLILDDVIEGLPVKRINLHTNPDKLFGGLSEPNPLNPEIQKEAIEIAKKEKPEFTVMWDGDGDRVFFLDENGRFVNAPYITAALVEVIAKKYPGSAVVCDERIVWPMKEACKRTGMRQVLSKSGYRFMKETMTKEDAVFGAETTAHYFFKETKYMDNGVIPFLMIWQLLSESGKTLSQTVAPFRENHFMIDELKFAVSDPRSIIEKMKHEYADGKFSEIDGLTVEFDDWRFNFRTSNTEPVAKLNLEAKSQEIMVEKTAEISRIVEEISQ